MKKAVATVLLLLIVFLFSSCMIEAEKSMDDYIEEYASDGNYYLLENGKAFIDSYDIEIPDPVEKLGAYPESILFIGNFDSEDISDMTSEASVIIFGFGSDIKCGVGATVISSLFTAYGLPEDEEPRIIKESSYLIIKKEPLSNHIFPKEKGQ